MIKKPEKIDKIQGQGCDCGAYCYGECGCSDVDWTDHNLRNKTIEEYEAYHKQEMAKWKKYVKDLKQLQEYKNMKLKDKCSVEKLEGIIDVNTFKGGISMVQDYILVPKKDLATAINRYIIENKQ